MVGEVIVYIVFHFQPFDWTWTIKMILVCCGISAVGLSGLQAIVLGNITILPRTDDIKCHENLSLFKLLLLANVTVDSFTLIS